jgi:hypothetical protein
MKANTRIYLPIILAVFTAFASKLAAQIPQPLLYLNFEGADPWLDQSDTANPVSVSGNVLGVPTGAPNGPSPGNGASFADGHLKLPGIHSLNDLQQYTMMAWLKPDRDNDGQERFVFGQESQGIHNGIRNNMYLHHAHWGSDQNGGTDLKGYFNNTATDGWIHATWTWDTASGTGQIYLDGVLDGEWNKNPPNQGNAMIIGARNGGAQQYRGIMDEVAIWNSVLSASNIEALADGAAPVDSSDEDEDTLPDWWEKKYAGDLTTLNGLAGDFDEDGLSDYDEFENGTDPTEEDTDADGLEDNVETNTGTFASATDTGTNPVVADTDGDGLNDGQEVFTHETNPLNRDTDGDGASDGAEITAGTDPLDEDSSPDVQLIQPSFPPLLDAPIGTGVEPNFNEPGLTMLESHYPGGVLTSNNTNQNWDRVVVNPDAFPPTRTKTEVQPYFDHGNGGFNTTSGGNRPYIDGGGDDFTIRVDGFVELEAGDYTIHLGADDTNYFVIDTPDGPRQTGHNCCPNNHTMTFNISVKSLCPFSNLMVERGGGDWGDLSISGPGFARVALGDVAGGSPPIYTIQLASVDTDEDLLPDWWETNYAGNLTALNGLDGSDFDEDSLTDFDEFENGTNPTEEDTDADGLEDPVETNTGTFVSESDTGTDPTKADTDEDGLNDGAELAAGTDPTNSDSDDDGFSDAAEIDAGTDPNDPDDTPDLTDTLQEGLIAYWPLDGDLTDVIGESNGTLMGGGAASFTAGQHGEGIDLDGVGQYIETPLANEELFDFPDGNGFSVSAWFRVDEFTKSWQCLIAKGEGNKWRIHRRGGEQVITGNGGAADVSPGLTNVNDGEIHHLVLVSDPANGSVTLYVDGQVEGTSGAPNLENNDKPLMIGENPDARNRTWSGLIDDIGIWNRPLTENEITYLYKGGEGNAIIAPSDDDNDGLEDSWELRFGLSPEDDGSVDPDNGPEGDPDEDGVINEDEFANRTDPTKADTDGDGLNDGVETNTGTFASATDTGTDPTNSDTDGDGLSDGVETNSGTFAGAADTGTDPHTNDTDADGFSDAAEVNAGTSPLNANDFPDSLLVYYDFEGDVGTTVTDKAGLGYDGTFNGAVELIAEGAPAGSSPGGSAQFTGGFINVPGIDMNTMIRDFGTGDYTMTCWIKPSDVAGEKFIFGQTNQGIHNGIRNNSYLHQAHWGADTNGATQLAPYLAADEDGWVHAAFVYDGEADQGTIYLDGQQDWAGQKNAPNGGGNLIIGGRNNGDGNQYQGLIDEVAVWTSALSAEKILELAEGGSPSGGSPVPLEITNISANFSGASPVVTLSFNSKPGKIYAVDRTADLLLWEELDDGLEGEGDSTEFVDSFLPEGSTVMFYRVRQVE